MAKALSERIELWRNIRDELIERMDGRVRENHNSYSIGDRSISKMTMEEVRVEYRKADAEVERLERQHRRKSGVGGGIRFKF